VGGKALERDTIAEHNERPESPKDNRGIYTPRFRPLFEQLQPQPRRPYTDKEKRKRRKREREREREREATFAYALGRRLSRFSDKLYLPSRAAGGSSRGGEGKSVHARGHRGGMQIYAKWEYVFESRLEREKEREEGERAGNETAVNATAYPEVGNRAQGNT